jgi:hypothetical protein
MHCFPRIFVSLEVGLSSTLDSTADKGIELRRVIVEYVLGSKSINDVFDFKSRDLLLRTTSVSEQGRRGTRAMPQMLSGLQGLFKESMHPFGL